MKVLFIWHMHQPFYKDLKTGDYLMPWVRLHGSKDYLDMLLILEEFPKIKQTFNLVPSLIEQIQDYTDNEAEDRHLYLSRKNPEILSENEKIEIFDGFFAANFATMIAPHARYSELYSRCTEVDRNNRLHSMNHQDIRDLQVWFNAVWIDPMFRQDDRIKRIYTKGGDFTEEEKQELLDFQIDILRRIIPAHQEKAKSGKIEVSFSPYYHPILPLLTDTDIAKEAMPGIALPKKRFCHPEDAEAQIKNSVALYHSLFGGEGMGMWPSEGSVSESILPILKRNGVKWIATDEEIFYASANSAAVSKIGLGNERRGIHAPYLVGGKENELGILFRDHKLSDKIGFVYSGWDPEKAANDFVAELERMSRDDDSRVVSVILDGENCWEFYQNDGANFLRSVYGKIERSKLIETVLPSEIFADKSKITRLPYLFPGSWINHNFRVWIGHDEDNAAWDLLSATRDQLVEFQRANLAFDQKAFDFAWREIYIAEGSDWCWWYGDDHQSEFFEMFDFLFRKHLLNIWETLGLEPPVALKRPIRKTLKQSGIFEPTDFVTPKIDGKQTNYFEWFGAGRVECTKLGGAMHRGESVVSQIFFGYDDDCFYTRIDLENEKLEHFPDAYIRVELICDRKLDGFIHKDKAFLKNVEGEPGEKKEVVLKSAWDQLVEVAIPREMIPTDVDKHLHFSIALMQKEKVIERWPEANYVYLEMPKRGESLFWQV